MTLVQGYASLFKADVLSSQEHAKAHQACQTYLNEYLSKAKRIISGREFADLVKCIGDAKK